MCECEKKIELDDVIVWADGVLAALGTVDLAQRVTDKEAAVAAAIQSALTSLEPIPMWVLYGPRTSDYPGKHVLRQFHIIGGAVKPLDPPVIVADTAKECRQRIPVHCIRFPREAKDDPNIIESWM